jgi:plastocyanin
MLLIPLITLLLLIGPVVISAAEAADYSVVVKPGLKAFTPQEMKIKLGDKVNWINESEEEHFLTSVGPLSKQMVSSTEELEIHKLLKPGEGYTHSFAKADTYYYFCAIHLQMWGTVIVEE